MFLFQCFCHNCDVAMASNLVSRGYRNLTIGQTTSCHYKTATAMTSSTHALTNNLGASASVTWHVTSPSSTRITLHAILWPTFFFVVGFVGLFFSGLHLYKSHQKVIRKVEFKVSVSGKDHRVF